MGSGNMEKEPYKEAVDALLQAAQPPTPPRKRPPLPPEKQAVLEEWLGR